MALQPQKKPRRQLDRQSGEDYLDTLKAITLILEDGTQHEFSMEKELAISEDLNRLPIEARKAPARLAFWTYQAGRALARLRAKENQLHKFEAESYFFHRQVLEERTDKLVTEAQVKACVDQDQHVYAMRVSANALRRTYDLLKCLRDAIEQRCFIVRGLLRMESDAAYRA